jgi:Carbohydrate-binding family 9
MSAPTYIVRRVRVPPEHRGAWDGPAWRAADRMRIAAFHARSSDHHPDVEAALLYDEAQLHALFRVHDRHVRSVHTAYDSDTYKDSCVELFVQPPERSGYFALEVNGGGAFSLRYIEDPARTADRFAKWTRIDPALAGTIAVAHSLPAVVDPEMDGPVDWWVEVSWPFAVMEAYCGQIRPAAGTRWRGNAFKCADETSHPHWASWAPIGDDLNFHQPRWFGSLQFELSSPD